MNTSRKLRSRRSPFLPILLLSLLTACSGITERSTVEIHADDVKALHFVLPQASLFGQPLPTETISQRVSDNLKQWGYVFSDAGDPGATHSLTAEIGAIQHGSTPVGFSFSAGNSDPRALDFQKNDILPIHCYLAPLGRPDERAAVTLEVLADDYSNNTQDSSSNALIDDISTACFNLLESLEVKPNAPPEKGLTGPSWIPEIRIEVEEVPEQPQANAPSVPRQATPSPATSEIAEDDDLEPNSAETREDSDARIRIEESATPQQSQGKTRKRIIIHNQGNPIILQFGHERK